MLEHLDQNKTTQQKNKFKMLSKQFCGHPQAKPLSELPQVEPLQLPVSYINRKVIFLKTKFKYPPFYEHLSAGFNAFYISQKYIQFLSFTVICKLPFFPFH